MTNILIAILLFSILVLFHEFGHFIAAKAVGIETRCHVSRIRQA